MTEAFPLAVARYLCGHVTLEMAVAPYPLLLGECPTCAQGTLARRAARRWRSVERLLASLDRAAPGGRWLTGRKPTALGYVRLGFQGRAYRGHRLLWRLLVGPIPPDRELDHRCRNRACVNPAHLELVTRQENRHRARKLVLLAACAHGHHPYLRTETRRVDGRYRTFCRACGRAALHTAQRRQALLAGQLLFLEPGEGGAETGA